MNHPSRQLSRSGAAAFTRADLVCLLGLAAALGLWTAFTHLGERGRALRCAANLARLGGALRRYAADHDGALPAASDALSGLTWDAAITPGLRPDLVNPRSAYARRRLAQTVAPDFVCPSDPWVRAHPRSYSMAAHAMEPEAWPPGPDNATGVGLVWDPASVNTLLGPGGWARARTNHDLLLPVKLAWLPDPADTLMLAEAPRGGNQCASPILAAVDGAGEQLADFPGRLGGLHRGRFNYLFADGHVEALSPLQTGWTAGPAGIWSLKKNLLK